MPFGYLDVYGAIRTWQKELHEMMDHLRPDMEEESKEALNTLTGVMYLVEGQLLHDADGAN